MKPSQGALVGLALVLLAVPPAPVGAATAGSGPEWFGPKGVDEGWHMRVNLAVSNPYGVTLTSLPVAAELDLATLLLDAGWSGFDAGAGPVLTGFELDLDSFRVVHVTSLGDFQGTGSVQGRILGEVPSLAMPGLLGRTSTAEETARPFDATRNPAATVFFRVPGVLEAGQTAFFQVYFDSVANGPAPPVQGQGVAGAAVEALHWHGAGVRLYGTLVSQAGTPNQVTVLAAHAGTQVTVTRLSQGAFVAAGVDLGGGSNKKTLAAGEAVVAQLGPQANPVFRVEANRPVVAVAQSQGFVPALDGGLVGSRFLVRTGPAPDGQAVYLINPGNTLAEVAVRKGDGGTVRYQIPGGFYGGSNLECTPGGTWAPLPAAQTLDVEVESGGPVLVQLQPRAQQQVPSVDGAPTGTRFMATALWSGGDSQCGVGQGQRLQAGALSLATQLHATSLEDEVQLFPRVGPPALLEDPPALTSFALPINAAEARDRPVLFEASQAIRLFAGGVTKNSLPTGPAGPLGGSQAGRSFAVPGSALVIALYPETRIQGTQQFASGSASLDEVLGQENLLSLEDDESLGPLQLTDLQASKPVLVYPRGASAGHLGGVPAFAQATVGPLSYRGRLLDVRGSDGEDPVQVSLKAGFETAVPLLVTNRGRGAIGTEAPFEKVRLDVAGLPPGWSARFDRPEVPLAPGQGATVNLRLTPAASGTGNNVLLSVVARSTDDPSVQDTATIAVFQKSTYGVGLWFLQPDLGPKTLQQDLAPGATHRYPVVVKNLGGQSDTIRLSSDTPQANEQVQLLSLQGQPVDGVLLAAGEARRLDLVATSGNRTDGLFVTTVTAQSNTASAVRDRITAVTRVRVPADLVIAARDPYKLVADGKESQFGFTLSNLAQGSANVRLALLSGAPASWPPSAVFAIDPVEGQRVALSATALDGGQAMEVVANLTVPAGVRAGTLIPLRLTAVAGSTYVEGTSLALVAARHAIVARTEPDVPQAVPGTVLQVELRLTNQGNLNESLRVLPGALPPGWQMVPTQVDLAQNASTRLPVSLTIPAASPAGRVALSVRLVAEDGTTAFVKFNATVPDVAGGAATLRSGLAAQPGQDLPVVVPFLNSGNLPVRASLAAASGEPWTLVSKGAVDVAPGANVTLHGSWRVPRDAQDGPAQHFLTVTTEPDSSEPRLGMAIDVGRPNLRLNATELLLAPSGTLVRAVVANLGDRDATDVLLHVVLDGTVVAEQQVKRIPAGRQADLLLALGRAVDAPLGVVLDPANAVVEADETDNQSLLQAAGKQAPAPGLWLAIVALLAALGRRRSPT